jgi:hypothetical protein
MLFGNHASAHGMRERETLRAVFGTLSHFSEDRHAVTHGIYTNLEDDSLSYLSDAMSTEMKSA